MNLNYKTFGEGAPLIILHGLFGSLDNWVSLAKKFATRYQVFIIDQRNHGRSPHADDISYPIMAEDLFDFMNDHYIPQSHILGHSMGGKTAMQFAFDFPEKIKKLIVVDIAPKAYTPSHEFIFTALRALDLKQLQSRNQADEFLQEDIKDFAIRQFLLKNLTRSGDGKFVWKINLEALYEHYAEILAATTSPLPFEGPTLFIKGGQSNYIQNGDLDKVGMYFTKAKIANIESAGHWLHSETPEEFQRIVFDFLAD